ncbi:MAG: hypothetical protein FJ179_03025 [Gammaproteobacteria bacterium]|nr:hypothetical protein [Gammaproteobacteria bacterium]
MPPGKVTVVPLPEEPPEEPLGMPPGMPPGMLPGRPPVEPPPVCGMVAQPARSSSNINAHQPNSLRAIILIMMRIDQGAAVPPLKKLCS